jgi:heterodisulfide reductase subunit C/nitrate reductase gamma subunit
MLFDITLYASLAIFAAGLIYKISNWFRYEIGPDAQGISTSSRISAAARGMISTLFSAKIMTLLRVLLMDVLLQRWLMKRDFLRWLAHICIYGGFMLLLLMHGLDKLVTAVLFDEYYSTLNPFMFLRDFFGLVVIIGIGFALYRRLISKAPRPRSTGIDYYAIIILAVIMISGIALEGTKIVSYSRYQEMVEEYSGLGEEETEELRALEAYWVDQFGVVSPNIKGSFENKTLAQGKELHEMSCAGCHSKPQWGFMGYGLATAIRPIALPLDRANVHHLLWYLHFMACFFGLAYLPFSKFFHIFSTPAYLLVDALVEEGRSDPANLITKQAMQVDACTHCGDCTIRCSVAVALDEIPNPNILPSEKLVACKDLLVGKKLSPKRLTRIQEGSHICTDCHRCTDVCPIGINLEYLWSNLDRMLSELGYPKPEAWAREAIGADFDLSSFKEKPLSLTPVDKEFAGALVSSAQASSFSVCFGCQNCTNVCPVVGNYENPKEVLGLLPHEIMHCLALKQKGLAIGSNMLWDCLTCYICQEHCPQGVRVTDVLYELKNLALKHLKEKAA